MSDKANEKSSTEEAKEKCVQKSLTLANARQEILNKKSTISAKALEGNRDRKFPIPAKETEKTRDKKSPTPSRKPEGKWDKKFQIPAKVPEERKDPVYSFYRVTSNGNPQIIIQSEGCCMLDKAGVMTKETVRTVQSEMGSAMARSIIGSKNLHFHVDMALMNKAKEQILSQATKSKSSASNQENDGSEKKTNEK